jgi:hypothetical protein
MLTGSAGKRIVWAWWGLFLSQGRELDGSTRAAMNARPAKPTGRRVAERRWYARAPKAVQQFYKAAPSLRAS